MIQISDLCNFYGVVFFLGSAFACVRACVCVREEE